MESWTYMGRTTNINIKDIFHIFAFISKNMPPIHVSIIPKWSFLICSTVISDPGCILYILHCPSTKYFSHWRRSCCWPTENVPVIPFSTTSALNNQQWLFLYGCWLICGSIILYKTSNMFALLIPVNRTGIKKPWRRSGAYSVYIQY